MRIAVYLNDHPPAHLHVLAGKRTAGRQFMDLSDEQIEQATERGAGQRLSQLVAVAARYDRGRGRIVIRLANGLEVMFAPGDAEGLAGAKAEQRARVG